MAGGWRDGEGAVLNPTPSVLSIYLEELERGLSCIDSWTAFPRKDKRSRIQTTECPQFVGFGAGPC